MFKNQIKTVLLLSFLMAIFLVIGYALGGQSGLTIAFIIALVLGIAFVDFIYSKKKKQKYYSGDDNDEI